MGRKVAVVASASVALGALAACSLLTSLDGLAGGDEPFARDGAPDTLTSNDGSAEVGPLLDAGDAADAADGSAVRSALYAQVVLADNPLGYWRFEETAGTMVKDETARIDGVYTNEPALGAPEVAGSRAAKLPKEPQRTAAACVAPTHAWTSRRPHPTFRETPLTRSKCGFSRAR